MIRESGIPYTIIRPCALTEEPAGADLIFDQGDNITVFKVPLTFNTILQFQYFGYSRLLYRHFYKNARQFIVLRKKSTLKIYLITGEDI